jgi:outer membrane lipoprotein-sorting protein
MPLSTTSPQCGLTAGPPHSKTMTRFHTSNRLRWAAPAVVAAAIAAAALTSNVSANASGQPKLAPKTAAQLLADVEQASPAGMSGTIVESVKLGLPSLPDIAGAGSGSDLSLSNLATGSHTFRVWQAGTDRQRLALLGQLSETDVIHNGADLWTYSSTTRKVTHSTLTDHADNSAAGREGGDITPQDAAQQALAAIDPTTSVQVDDTARVAGVAAYQLQLTPKDTRSLIGSVRIAIAADNSVPLRVQVYARGATSPAIEVGFTDVSFSVPSASIFTFVPPAGTTVIQQALPFGAAKESRTASSAGKQLPTGDGNPTVIGHGWTAVVETSAQTGAGSNGGPGVADQTQQLLDRVATPVAGGRVITSALLSVLITNDGRIFAGPVSAAALEQVASTGQGL